MSATTEAINAAEQALDGLLDATRPLFVDAEAREALVAWHEQIHEHLHTALLEATRARPMTTWHKGVEARRPSEDGTNPASPRHD